MTDQKLLYFQKIIHALQDVLVEGLCPHHCYFRDNTLITSKAMKRWSALNITHLWKFCYARVGSKTLRTSLIDVL